MPDSGARGVETREQSAQRPHPWAPGAATAAGSLPGGDPLAACRLVLEELPDLPFLPELPARGPGADPVGRAAGVLVDLHVDLQPSGWRLVDRPGVDVGRARDLMRRDLDALEEAAQGYAGPLKVQLLGPWSLAAGVELTRGDKVLSDPGAVRDVAASLTEGLRSHLAEVRRRVPGAQLVLQVDEPALPAALAGQVRTASGFGRLRSVDPVDARTVLGPFLAQQAYAVVACHRPDPPLVLLADAGARGLAADAAALAGPAEDTVGELVERGVALFVGVLPALGPGVPPTTREVVEPVRALWRRLGFAPERLAETVVPTTCGGLGEASEGWTRTALRLSRQAGRALYEAPDGSS